MIYCPDEKGQTTDKINNILNGQSVKIVEGKILSAQNETEYSHFKTETESQFVQRYTKTEIRKAIGYPFEIGDGFAWLFEESFDEAFKRKRITGRLHRPIDNVGMNAFSKANYADNLSDAFYYSANGTIETSDIVKNKLSDGGAIMQPYCNVYKLASGVNAGKYFYYYDHTNNKGLPAYYDFYAANSFYKVFVGVWVLNDSEFDVPVKLVIGYGSTSPSNTKEVLYTLSPGECKFIENEIGYNQEGFARTVWLQKNNDSSSQIYVYGMIINRRLKSEQYFPEDLSVGRLCNDANVKPHIRSGDDPTTDGVSLFEFDGSTPYWTGGSWKFTCKTASTAGRQLKIKIPPLFYGKNITLQLILKCTTRNLKLISPWEYTTGVFNNLTVSTGSDWVLGTISGIADSTNNEFIIEIVSGAVNEFFHIGDIKFYELFGDGVDLEWSYQTFFPSGIIQQKGTIFLKWRADNFNLSSGTFTFFGQYFHIDAPKVIEFTSTNSGMRAKIQDGSSNNAIALDNYVPSYGEEVLTIIRYDLDAGVVKLWINDRTPVEDSATSWVSYTPISKQESPSLHGTYIQLGLYDSLIDDADVSDMVSAGKIAIVQKTTIGSYIKQTAEQIALKALDVFINGFRFNDKELYAEDGKFVIEDLKTQEKLYMDANEVTFLKDSGSGYVTRGTIGIDANNRHYRDGVVSLVQYKTDSGGDSYSNGSEKVVNFEDVVYDQYSEVTTGSSWIWTCPRDGFYLSFVKMFFTTGQISTGDYVQLRFFKNAARIDISENASLDSTSGRLILEGRVFDYFTAGQTLQVKVFNFTGSTITKYASGENNHIEIIYIGGVI